MTDRNRTTVLDVHAEWEQIKARESPFPATPAQPAPNDDGGARVGAA